jgi:hypothetical protein
MQDKNIVKHDNHQSVASATLEKIYDDLRSEIIKKDELIQTLSVRV